MNKQIGIDVSEFNGLIDWSKVKPHIDFAMLRAGFGSSTSDEKFKINATNCSNLRIPFGVYWFSYAYTKDMAIKEANRCLSMLKSYHISCPVAFDFEYASVEYAKKKGVTISAELMCEIAKAFLDTVKQAGYIPMLYTNLDFWNRGFKKLNKQYAIWFAQWGVEKPAVYCSMWQDSSNGKIEGINTYVDTNISYVKYIIPQAEDEIKQKLDGIHKKYNAEYVEIARDVINGVYGNGADRVNNLKNSGFDPSYVQEIVNALLGY